MRKIVLTTKSEKIHIKYKKYIVNEIPLSTEILRDLTLKDIMSVGRFAILDISDLDINMIKHILTYIHEFRYKVYATIDCEHQEFMGYIRNQFKYIRDVEDIEEYYNFSQYKRIFHIGDIHGCFDTFMEFWKKNYNLNDLFIFTGDLADRGKQSIEMIDFCLRTQSNPNIIFLEGNHDTNLWYYSQSYYHKMHKSFMDTCLDLKLAGFKKHELEKFVHNMKEVISYKFLDKRILVCHGGIKIFPRQNFLIDSNNFINGQGNDYTEIDKLFTNNTSNNFYQIHGHRNICGYKSDRYIASQNLEGGVENGGCLRVSILIQNEDHAYFKNLYIKNKYKDDIDF